MSWLLARASLAYLLVSLQTCSYPANMKAVFPASTEIGDDHIRLSQLG